MTAKLHPANLSVIVLYMMAVVAVGAWFSRREETSEEYLLGGRRMPWWAVGISYMMSLLSTVSLVMVPGEIYNHGLSLYILGPLYPLTSILMFYAFVRFYYKLEVFTPFAYLGRRYDPAVRLLISILYLWTRLIYLAWSSSARQRSSRARPVGRPGSRSCLSASSVSSTPFSVE